MTKRSFDKSAGEFRKKIEVANEKNRQNIEKYLSDVLSEKEARVNALLLRINDFDPMKSAFELDKSQYYQNIWLQSATLLSANKWIDLIQTSFNHHLSSLITVNPNMLEDVELRKDSSGVTVAIPPGSDSTHHSFIAIPITLSDFLANVPPIANPEKEFSKFYALFSKESIMQINTKNVKFQVLNLSINPLEPYIHWIEASFPKTPIAQFIHEIETAQKALATNPKLLENIKQSSSSSKSSYYDMNQSKELVELISRFDQIGMIWGLTTVISSGPFAYNPFTSIAPVGFVRKDSNQKKAHVLYKDQVFSNKSVVKLPDRKPTANFENTLTVISPQDRLELFFGNTLYIPSKQNLTEITIGINGNSILKSLALSTQKTSAFISHGLLISAFTQDAKPISSKEFSQQDIEAMLASKSGTISFQGEEYYFIHMRPFQNLDFHFYSLTPLSKEFGLIKALNQNAAALVAKISWQMRSCAVIALLIVLVVLSQIAKRVTQPISVLATATHFVKEGKLDEVQIPKLKKVSQNNEVDMLYQSFSDMVEGLKEKERVRGVLNKVVSQEIADEILKNETHLGGEEKDVTVFFADIRSFTTLTEKMSPKDVIELLNSCMTKVSKVVDKNGGVIDKYVGDEVMALFGAPISNPESSNHAVLCAIEVIATLNEWNEERVKNNMPKVEMGIGIHKGVMVAGNMGAEDRLNYTVLGSNVNLGARLCSKAEAMQILISKEVYAASKVEESINVKKLENVELKGFSESFEVYEVISRKA